ncbi:Transcription repressor OFP13 [Striga hermonthica]|uniref:Transcription repressor n=1 Tax=Striga hermonthica TaxID=68872 RepID=A0A9N7RA51_STRHE|nr:Transcription repressor OFP13 [Striga hermonthica]
MKLPFLFKSSETTTTTTAVSSSATSWRWPACAAHPRTLSFRAESPTGRKSLDVAGTFPDHNDDEASSPELQTATKLLTSSERFFFKPGSSNSILEEAKTTGPPPRKSAVILVMLDSHDPVRDFRASMEDMVAARGGCDWEYLENLLECYLRENGERNHGYIIGAFVDLVFRLDSGSEHSSAAVDGEARRSFASSTLSFSSSSACSSSSASACNLPKNGGCCEAAFDGGAPLPPAGV